MIVPDEIRKCVAFLAVPLAEGGARLIGTAFVAGRRLPDSNRHYSYAITAAHVIRGAQNLGTEDILFRVNQTDGQARWLKSSLADWRFHPTDALADVAAIPAGIGEDLDHRIYPLDQAATDEVIASDGIGIGDEIFTAGLFVHHHGNTKNIPIIRVGNIAAMREEPVRSAMGPIDAYLVEVRSIGGLSGSPVFVHLGITRYIDGQVKHAQSGPIYHLLGVMQGHWDGSLTEADASTPRRAEAERVNIGIGIVVPVQKVIETVDQPEFVRMRS